ncbi:MAG: PorP/SprF family type IX secretion system membrane protein [Bacteroidales bacterium]|nr:PorP/SprF family type IX secretion system membrane protein [Bacteroidales bacterium]
MYIKTKIFVFIFVLSLIGTFSTKTVQAQDPNYSQFFSNPLYYNPAYTGISQGLRVRLDYRKQWPNLRNDFQTYNFNTDISIREFPGSGGLGLMFNKDRAGAGFLETSTAAILTAVRIRLTESFFTQVGVMSSFVQKSVNWDRFVFTDQINPRYGNIYETGFVTPGNDQLAFPDFNVGAVFRFAQPSQSSTNIFGTFGFAVHHVFSPSISFFDKPAPLPRKIVLHADMIFESEGYSGRYSSSKSGNHYSKKKFNPGIYYETQGEFQTIAFGINMYYKSLYGGIWYRNSEFSFSNAESLVLLIGLNTIFNDVSRIKILYSYDLALDDDLLKTGGAHEISLIIELDDISLFNSGGSSGRWSGSKKTTRNNKYEMMECSPF